MAEEEIKKYYSCYREGILTSSNVEEEYLYCVESKIRLPNWYEIETAEAKEMIFRGVNFIEL